MLFLILSLFAGATYSKVLTTPSNALGSYCQAPHPELLPLPEGYTLLQVHLVHRHGDRTPVQAFPYIPYYTWNCSDLTSLHTTVPPGGSVNIVINETRPRNAPLKGDCDVGELTFKGFQQAVKLGTTLRQHYVTELGFLPSNFNASLARIFSGESPRCVRTAEGVVDGLWPAENNIVITRFSKGGDITDPDDVLCTGPKYQQYEAEAKNSTAFKNWLQQNIVGEEQSVIQYFNISDTSPLGFFTFYNIWDSFACAYCHGLSLPEHGTALIDNAWLHRIALKLKYTFTVEAQAKDLRPYNVAPLFEAILEVLQNLNNNTSNPKWVQWSAHDSTIQAILEATGNLPTDPWIGYTSAYIIEIAEDAQGNKMHRRIYNDRVTSSPQWEPFDKLLGLLSAHIPKDWHDVCFGF